MGNVLVLVEKKIGFKSYDTEILFCRVN